MALTPPLPVSPALVATIARAAGLPAPLVAFIEVAEGPALSTFATMVHRLVAGDPVDEIIRAHAPDPVAALNEVDNARGR